MKKLLKAIFEFFALLLGADCDARRDAVSKDLLDLSGQGKNKFGR